jgi:hypothetical protein
MNTPWYRQFWPWFLIALPGSVVIAGLLTWAIAARHADDLVVNDYYRSGLAINRNLEMLERARTLGLEARVALEDGRVSVTLLGKPAPPALKMLLSHPLEADRDQVVRLPRAPGGQYLGEASWDPGTRWLWVIEPLGLPEEQHWRLDGEVVAAP